MPNHVRSTSCRPPFALLQRTDNLDANRLFQDELPFFGEPFVEEYVGPSHTQDQTDGQVHRVFPFCRSGKSLSGRRKNKAVSFESHSTVLAWPNNPHPGWRASTSHPTSYPSQRNPPCPAPTARQSWQSSTTPTLWPSATC